MWKRVFLRSNVVKTFCVLFRQIQKTKKISAQILQDSTSFIFDLINGGSEGDLQFLVGL